MPWLFNAIIRPLFLPERDCSHNARPRTGKFEGPSPRQCELERAPRPQAELFIHSSVVIHETEFKHNRASL
jgi:hypothetical protein